jgi:outer membrane immunogenic protein
MAATAALVAAATARAADMPVTPVYQPPPPAPPPIFYNWTRCYAGLHVGIARSDVNVVDLGNATHHAFSPLATLGQSFTANDDSLFGGGQLGCNFQGNGPFVIGLESNLGWMDIGAKVLEPGSVNTTVGLGPGFYGDITGRLGYAVGAALFYAKGGWASYTGKETFSTNLPASLSDVGVFNGYVAGAGIEYRLSYSWSAKLEYLHFGLGKQNFFVQSTGGVFQFRENPNIDTVKLGVNYLFY